MTPHQDGTFLYNEPLRLFGFWFPIGRDSNLSAPGITWAPILKSLTNVTSTSENTIFRCASNSISSFEVVTVTFLASASSRLSSLFSFTKNLYNCQTNSTPEGCLLPQTMRHLRTGACGTSQVLTTSRSPGGSSGLDRCNNESQFQ